jgi:hypothetical protein
MIDDPLGVTPEAPHGFESSNSPSRQFRLVDDIVAVN